MTCADAAGEYLLYSVAVCPLAIRWLFSPYILFTSSVISTAYSVRQAEAMAWGKGSP